MAHKNNSICGCRAREARRAPPKALIFKAAMQKGGAEGRAPWLFVSLSLRASSRAAEGGRAAVRACAGSQERSGRFPDRPPAGKPRGSSGTVLRFSRNPVTFYGETLDNPDLA